MNTLPFETKRTPSSRLQAAIIWLYRHPSLWQSPLEESLRVITHAMARALQVSQVSIWRHDASGDFLECLCRYRAASGEHDLALPLPRQQFPRYFDALDEDRLICANDALNDHRTCEFVSDYLLPQNIRSMLDATLREAGQTRGVVCAEHLATVRLWSRDEQEFATSVADLVAQVMLFHRMRDGENRHRALFELARDAIVVIKGRTIVDCNRSATVVFARPREDIVGKTPIDLSPHRQPCGELSSIKAVKIIENAYAGIEQHFSWQHSRGSGETFSAQVTIESIEVLGEPHLQAIVRDASMESDTDPLTGLPNRRKLNADIDVLIANDPEGVSPALILLDLNHFKDVNDTLGHATGDALLMQVAERLAAAVAGPGRMLARLGGDEFALLIKQCDGIHQARLLAARLIDALRAPLRIDETTLSLSGSLGIALYPEHGQDSQSLMRCADVAMYHAKSTANSQAVYSSQFDAHSPRRLRLMADLAGALKTDQLFLHYQPKIDLGNGRCLGCEALLRWQHPEFGSVPPVEFIPFAENSALIHELSLHVADLALAQMNAWDARQMPVSVAINVSARNLLDFEFPERLGALLVRHGIAAERLELEITESALITDPERALSVVRRLSELGVRLSIDDFGTGYSSLSYLKRLPIQALKIDRSFVMDMIRDEQDALIVRSIINLAHTLGLQVVAEGVEDGRTLESLASQGCDLAQGYHISRPLTASAFEDWLWGQTRAFAPNLF